MIVALLLSALRLSSLSLDVTVDYDQERLAGVARVEVLNVGTQSAMEASLLLGRLMSFEGVHDAADHELRFRQQVVTFVDEPKLQVNQALVALEPPLGPGEKRVLAVRYSGILVGYTETGSLYIQDHVERDFTILRTDAYAFPVVATTSRVANKSVGYADFPYEFSLTVPDGLTVANGGELVDRRSTAGRTTWSYRSRGPAPFLNIAIAPYELTERDGVRLYSFPKDRAGAARVLEASRRALELYGRWFGPTPEPPRFAIIEIPDGFGSQASLVGGIIQTADVFTADASLQPLYHELSHLWNPPEREPLPPRWNEGLASYLQRRTARELDGWDGLEADLARRLARLKEEGAQEPRLATVPAQDYGKVEMTDWSYLVGSLMFALLDRTLGPEKFNAVVRDFYQANCRTGASSAEFARFVASRGGKPAQAILSDWYATTRWWTRVSAGESLDALARSYLATP